ncbi:MAG TPA: hypothetical protein VGD37_30525 [Kofleriaceae bacterium]
MRRAALTVLVLLVLAPAGVQAATWFRAHDGELRTACCCPGQARHHGPAAPTTEVRAACCCTIIQLPARAASERTASPDVADEPAAVACAVTAVSPPRAVVRVAVDRPCATRGPPDLFARHCALLL